MPGKPLLLLAAAMLLGSLPVFAVGPSFRPDTTFTGSSLTGWHTIGGAQWRAENGEVIATPKQNNGGWLVLDRSYQDIGVYTQFRCTETCEAGVLFRAAGELGALAGGSEHGADLGAFGEDVGLAFQLLDDVLDVTGPPERTGKPRGADLLDGTITLPFIEARRRDPELAARTDPETAGPAATSQPIAG